MILLYNKRGGESLVLAESRQILESDIGGLRRRRWGKGGSTRHATSFRTSEMEPFKKEKKKTKVNTQHCPDTFLCCLPNDTTAQVQSKAH